jgi:hypothetical protein
MRTVKLNNWEPIFETKINTIRAKELAHLRSIKYLDAICVYLWVIHSAKIQWDKCFLKGICANYNHRFNAGDLYHHFARTTDCRKSVHNIGIDQHPHHAMKLISFNIKTNYLFLVNAFPWVLSSIINGLVSKRRFDSFFAIKCANAPASEFYAVIDQHKGNDPEALLELKGNSFGWGEDRQPAIENVNFIGKKVCKRGRNKNSVKNLLILGQINWHCWPSWQWEINTSAGSFRRNYLPRAANAHQKRIVD